MNVDDQRELALRLALGTFRDDVDLSPIAVVQRAEKYFDFLRGKTEREKEVRNNTSDRSL